MKEKNDHPSKISNLRKEACKNQCFNRIRTRGLREYRWCNALPTELWSHTLWTRSKVINLTQSNLNLTYFGIVLLCNEALKMCLYLFTPPRSDKFASSISLTISEGPLCSLSIILGSSTWIPWVAKVVGLNHVQRLNFFRLFFQKCYGCIHIYYSFTFFTEVNIPFDSNTSIKPKENIFYTKWKK